MKLSYANKARVGFGFDVFEHMYFRFFEQSEIMFTPAAKEGANNLSRLLADDNKSFHSVAFFLTRIPTPLSFFGRSMGDSVQSKSTAS